ncbi:hypothetical protein BGZ49_002843 [Haplosporangium sp. Z 27]|nr:hypothetical protein BGZ49_002843 [Haplosporangium sp. Z 27]
MITSTTPPKDIILNPDVDEYLRKEGMTEEEWKRIYELRYCTILVPFEDDLDEEDTKQDHKGREQISNNNTKELISIEAPSTPLKRQEQKQLPTPKSTQSRKDITHTLSRKQPYSPTRNIGLQTPKEKQSRNTINQAHTQKHKDIKNIQDDDLDDGNTDSLTISDPLATYLSTSRNKGYKSTETTPGHSSNFTMGSEDEDMEFFHDALDSHDENDQGEGSALPRAGLKRRHWELEQLPRLLQPTQPTATKRVALASSFTSTPNMIMSGLLKPRSFSPSPAFSSLQRRGSTTSDTSSVSHQSFSQSFSQSLCQNKLWTSQDWKTLESIYGQMNGNDMAENDLVQIADRFLTEQEAQTGEKSFWSREKVLMRCVVLYRVRSGAHWDSNDNASKRSREATPLFGLRGASRRSANPYPVQDFSRSKLSSSNVPPVRANGTSSSAIADFLSSRRAERSEKQRDAGQSYQLKSVFKHRLASGLRTVSQLIPFWKDVEQGNTNIQKKEKVPLGVPLGVAQAVIESFESKSMDSDCSGSVFSRSGSVLSNSDERSRNSSTTSLPTSFSSSSSPPTSSIADMLAKGHSVRSASAASDLSLA